MFAADLSWTDPTDEKVGERKERKSKEKLIPSKTPSIKSSRSSTQEIVWQSASKKAKSPSIKPLKTEKTNGSHETNVTKKLSKLPPRPLDFSSKDPILQPTRTFSSTLSPTLPSGASIDLPGSIIPDPDCESWSPHSRKSNSSRSCYSRDDQLDRKSSEEVIDEVHEIQQLSPKSFISRTTRRSAEVCVPEKVSVPSSWLKENVKYDKHSYSVDIQGCLDLNQFQFEYEGTEEITPPQVDRGPSYDSNVSPTLLSWKAPSEWDVILSTEPAPRKRFSSIGGDSSASDRSLAGLTHFQRFIRRMENAGPKIILDRLKEEWNDPVDEEADDELQLEKQLWVLTALQLQTLDKSSQPSQAAFGQLLRLPTLNHGRKILELYGNLAEVYQISAMQPKEKIYYLSTKPQGPTPVPANVSYLCVPQAGLLPFPYATSSFNHIRTSSLPSAVPSAKLPHVFRECHRLLAPGGILEIRIMDSSPDRKTSGPKMRGWLEDRLSLNLEKAFRCSRPCMLVPSWVKDAGFSLLHNSSTIMQALQLPTAFDPQNDTVHDELSTLVGRALWKDIWGEFVEERQGEPRWWWEDEEVVSECLDRKTIFECATLFAFKEN